jgi:Ca2+:H+ antiporter
MEKMFDWAGEQMALYLGQALGDLLIITMNK